MAFYIILGIFNQEGRDVTDVLLSSNLCWVQTQELTWVLGQKLWDP